MPRYARLAYPNQYYHLMNRGLGKQKIFLDKDDYLKFLNNLLSYKEKFDWSIYCYCLLPNHYHLLVKTQNDPLDNIMKSLQTAYGVYFNKKYKRTGPVFNGRFKSTIIQKGDYFLYVSKYIHRNPLKANVCQNLSDYPYSSYPEYMGKTNPAIKKEIIDKRAMRTIFEGKATGSAIKNYQAFIEEPGEEQYSLKRSVYGGKTFIAKFSSRKER